MERKKNNKRNIVLFFLKMILLFVIFDIVLNNIIPLFINIILTGKYGNQVIVEACAVFLALLIIILFKNTYIFNEKKEGFLKSLSIGGFMLALSIGIFLVNLTSITGSINRGDIVSLAIFCLLIGIFEEFLCRGWIQNEFIERFAKNRKEVILSIILSSLIFGGMHITNIWFGGQGVLETIAQIIQATGLGILLGSIYYRSKNIWASVFLHGFWDFAVFLSQINVIKECTTTNTSMRYLIYILITSILLTIVYFLISLYILRKSKTNKLIEEYTDEEIKKSDSNCTRLVLVIIILYFSICNLPIEEAEEICYDYEAKALNYNEVIYPDYDTYTIKENDLNIELSITSNNELLIKDLETNIEKTFDKAYIDQFMIIKNNNNYIILLRGLNDLKNDTIIYYSDFINLDNFSKEYSKEEYLDLIIESFNTLDTAPTTYKIGYIISVENNIKYPFIETSVSKKLVLYENDFYILDKTNKETLSIEDDIEPIKEDEILSDIIETENSDNQSNQDEDLPLSNESEEQENQTDISEISIEEKTNEDD